MTEYNDWSSRRRFVTKQLNYRNPYFPRESTADRRKRHRRLITIGITVLLIALAYFLLISPVFQIREITVEGGTTDRISFIEGRVDEYLRGKSLGIFKNDNWFINSSNRTKAWLENDLSNKISLDSLIIEKIFPRTIKVKFRERTAQIILEVNGRTYLLDKLGYVISEQYLNPVVVPKEGEPAAPVQQKPNYPVVRYSETESVTIGRQVLPAVLVQSILDTNHDWLEKYDDISIDHFETIVRDCPILSKPDETVTNTNTNTNLNNNINSNQNENTNEEVIEKEVVPCTEQPMMEYILVVPTTGVKLYFSSKYPTNDQINAFNTAYSGKVGGLFNKLKYIDLRYPGRVYYK